MAGLTTTYLDHAALTARLHDLAANGCEGRASVSSIGKSVQGRDLWVVKIGAPLGDAAAAAATGADGTPLPGRARVKLIGNMHGDEVVGRTILINLIEYVCGADGGADDPRVQQIRNAIDLYVLPTMNPDGHDLSLQSATPNHRENANKVDLNRNFPDGRYEQADSSAGRQPETAAVMQWIHSTTWALSANFHGGAVVANYPWDARPLDGQTATPDDSTFRYLATTYANAHTHMWWGSPCPDYPYESFPGGITQGYQWYDVFGGMQDYNYHYAHTMEITVELSCTKWPNEAEIPKHWTDNRNALLEYVRLPLRIGVVGTVVDDRGQPLPGVAVTLDEVPGFAVVTDANGVFWRLAAPSKDAFTVRGELSGYLAGSAAARIVDDTYTPAVVEVVLLPTISGWVIALLVFGFLLLAALLIAGGVYLYRRRRGRGGRWPWQREDRGIQLSDSADALASFGLDDDDGDDGAPGTSEPPGRLPAPKVSNAGGGGGGASGGKPRIWFKEVQV